MATDWPEVPEPTAGAGPVKQQKKKDFELSETDAEYTATVCWERAGAAFVDDRYSRAHEWQFDGGQTIPASASPHIVPLPYSVAANVDPEEAFVASLSSCHMLFFLSLAARRGFVVDDYCDEALGILGSNNGGRASMTRVILRPRATYSGDKVPTASQVQKLHHRSHELCFIANSVKTDIRLEIIS